MNIRTNEAGSISHQDILNQGFSVAKIKEFSDMGQSTVTLTDYYKGNVLLTGGYWNWSLQKDGKEIFSGWWNSNEEFIQTLKDLIK